MKIQVTLEREEFEPILRELLSRALNRPLSSNEVVHINFEADRYGNAVKMSATVEPPKIQPENLMPSFFSTNKALLEPSVDVGISGVE